MSTHAPPLLGVTVLADYIICEGTEAVLDTLVERAGANAVAINPSVAAKSVEGVGTFQPPDDAGSSPRLFDRPLWGDRSLWVRGAPSYHPDELLYVDSPYRPRRPTELTDEWGHVIGEFIDAALARGFKVYFQVSATRPPAADTTGFSPSSGGVLAEDEPHLPNGRNAQQPMADTTCLASDGIRAYIRALVRDLLQAYPRISGFRPDWPEYPCYKLDEAFHDFSPHVRSWARARGWDFDGIREQVGLLYEHLHGGLRNDDLEPFAAADGGRVMQASFLRRFPAITDWLRLKSALSVDLLGHWRSAINDAGHESVELSANAFMPPFSLFTGFDFAGAAAHCTAVSPKLYTMHWALMVSFWGERLLQHNPGLDEGTVVRSLANLFDLDEGPSSASLLSEYHYPEPDDPHPVPSATQRRKISQVIAENAGHCAVTPIVHGYGPREDFERRFELAAHSSTDGVWINRYGYLSDHKLDSVGSIWRTAHG